MPAVQRKRISRPSAKVADSADLQLGLDVGARPAWLLGEAPPIPTKASVQRRRCKSGCRDFKELNVAGVGLRQWCGVCGIVVPFDRD